MKKNMVVIELLVFSMLMAAVGAGFAFAGEKAPQAVTDTAHSTLAAIGTESAIVQAVKAQNAKGLTLDSIKAQDKKWKAEAGVKSYMSILINNDCGKFVTGLLDKNKYMVEIFVMDNQGANVCMTDKTSDYWQGDEAKFKKSFNGGAGAVFVDDVEFDESTQAYLAQVSVPVKSGGKVIGAITFGVDVDRI